MKIIGSRLRYLRKLEKLTLKDFSGLLGLSPSYIAELEKDKKNPSERVIVSICQTFKVTRSWIEEGEGEMYSDQPSRLMEQPRRSAKESQIVGRMSERLFASRKSDISVYALMEAIFEIDDDDLLELLDSIIFMSQNGDMAKIEAVKMMIRALDLQKERYRKRWRREETRREMTVYIDKKIAHYAELAYEKLEKRRGRFMPVNMKHSFADRFQFLRERINLNQSQMARLLNMSPGYVSKIEKGLIPSDKLIRTICEEFKVRWKWMKEGESPMYGGMHSASQLAL